MVGIKETKEAIVGVNEVSLFLVSRLKDGLDLDDFGAAWDKLVNDKEFKKVIEEAFTGLSNIPDEIKDLDIRESMDILGTQADYVAKIVEELQKK